MAGCVGAGRASSRPLVGGRVIDAFVVDEICVRVLVGGRTVVIGRALVGVLARAHGARRRERRAGQAAQLSGPVQPDEDLAEQPLEASRLAPGP